MSEPAPKMSCGQLFNKLLKAVLITVFVLFLLIGLLAFEIYPFQFIYHVIAGWLVYLMNVQSQVTMNYDLLWSSLIALGIAIAGFHGVARWLWKQSKPEAQAWRFRWTASIVTMLLLLFASANAGAGIGHQIGWLKSAKWIEVHGMSWHMREGSKGRQLMIDLKNWASDHNGEYPKNLSELASPGGDILDADTYQQLVLFRVSRDATPEPWLYLGSELKDSSPDHLMVLASPQLVKGKRIMVQNGGIVSVATEEDYQKALAELRKYLSQPHQ